MAIQKTEAFVIRTQPFRSSSLIVTFFSRSFGKLKGLVKGVRREGEMRGAVYELFTHLDIVFYEKKRSDLHLVSEAAIIESNDFLRRRLDTIAYASYFAELADLLTEVHDPHEDIFFLLDLAYRYLPSLSPEKVARVFEIKLLNEIGWLPHLDACLECQKTAFDHGRFSVSQGAILCPGCAPGYGDAREVSPEGLAFLRYSALHSFDQVIRYRILAPVEKELGDLMEKFLLYRTNKPFKTREFMKALPLN